MSNVRLRYFCKLQMEIALGFIRKEGFYKGLSVYDVLIDLGITPWVNK